MKIVKGYYLAPIKIVKSIYLFMRTFLLLFIFTLFMNNLFAQTEKANYKKAADKFEIYYNEENYDSIFSMFSIQMQQALPIDKTKAFLQDLKSGAGQIIKRQFLKYENGSYASYKTAFEKALFAVNISVDNNDRVNGLLIKPFTDIALPK